LTQSGGYPTGVALNDPGDRMVAVVMSENAARSLAAACQLGKFRVEDWLDDPLDVGRGTDLRQRAERAREWLDWGQRWLVDGTRLEVPA
jgi:hypothetical protein